MLKKEILKKVLIIYIPGSDNKSKYSGLSTIFGICGRVLLVIFLGFFITDFGIAPGLVDFGGFKVPKHSLRSEDSMNVQAKFGDTTRQADS